MNSSPATMFLPLLMSSHFSFFYLFARLMFLLLFLPPFSLSFSLSPRCG